MLKTNISEIEKEQNDLYNSFFEGSGEEANVSFDVLFAGKLYITIKIDDKTYEYEEPEPVGNALKQKSLRKRYCLRALYKALSAKTGKTLPWGSFTGIRPTALAREAIENNETNEFSVTEFLEREFLISHEKALLCSKILKNQHGIIKNDHLIDFYVNIPVCPTRCAYCSFISSEMKAVEKIMPEYLEALKKEIRLVKQFMFDKALIVRNVYIGGGTPTVLDEKSLDELLSELSFKVNEFTVECGRPDTITREKLEVLEKHGVNRICINPQTFSDATLKRIGRQHKKEDVFEAYSLALEKGFEVNMDMIVGLPGESGGAVKKTVDTLLDLYPSNITVHTLSLKRGSLMQDEKLSNLKNLNKILSQTHQRLMEAGYKPYYLYRQKHQLGGLENVGFARDNLMCQFNIDSMEECSSIMAVGAGAISKRVFSLENRIERQANPKFLKDYIERIDEMIEKKKQLFS